MLRCRECGEENSIETYGAFSKVIDWLEKNNSGLKVAAGDAEAAVEQISRRCNCGGNFVFMRLSSPVKCIVCAEYVFPGKGLLELSASAQKAALVALELPELTLNKFEN